MEILPHHMNSINVSNKNNTLCLCMIVKNESKIITRMFDSVISIIDTYCICDTGSDDDTINIIKKYFNEKGIKGIIIEEPFINFCYNRNFALDKCNGMSDYILLMDADMKLEINNFNKSLLNVDIDVFYILQGNNSFYYPNKRIIRNNARFKYYGVTHEYISMDSDEKILNIDKSILFINDIGDGGSKSKKFERDIALLTQGIIDEPKNTRYYFYLGNSYKDSGNYLNAIVEYKKLLEFKNSWVQEKYISCIRIYESYRSLEKESDGIYYLIESYKYDNIRIEGIYRLIKYYCITGENNIAYTFYTLIQNYYENLYINDKISSKLFLNIDEYEFYLPYYMIIVSERLRKYDIGIKMFEIIFKKEFIYVGEWWITHLVFNLQFFIDKVSEENSIFFRLCENYINKVFNKLTDKSKELLKSYEKYGFNFEKMPNQITNIINYNKYIILDDNLKNHIDMAFYTFASNLQKYGWEIILLSNLNIEEIKLKKCILYCLTFESFDISFLKYDNIKLLYHLCDLHPYNEIKNKCIENCDIIISPFNYLFPKWRNIFKSIMDKPNYVLQGCSIKNYFHNINFRKDPIRKIFVSGYINKTYPFKNYMLNLSKENNNIEIMNHPSYENRTHNIVHQAYYEKLNEYLCCFVDALIWNYIVGKVFEITASGSLLLVQDSIEKQLNELEFYDGVNCIMCNQDNVISKIDWIMDEKNREKVDEIRMKGMILTREKHNTEVKAELFNKYIDGLV
jgi:hypothetical protein